MLGRTVRVCAGRSVAVAYSSSTKFDGGLQSTLNINQASISPKIDSIALSPPSPRPDVAEGKIRMLKRNTSKYVGVASALVTRTSIRSIYGRPKFLEIPVLFLQRFLGAGITGARF